MRAPATIVWATCAGDIQFLEPLHHSFLATVGNDAALVIMLDETSGIDPRACTKWCCDHRVWRSGSPLRSLNARWVQCVERSRDSDICVVLNDDVYLTPGWLDAIQQVLTRNPHVGLVGIPADGAWHEAHHARDRWFDDPTLFSDPHFFCHSEGPWARYESHTSGFCWACRPQQWLDAGCADIGRFDWGYGEFHMSDLLRRKAGLLTVSVYYPLIAHYGGGGTYVGMSQPRRDDAAEFAKLYQTGHMHLVHDKWERENCREDMPPIVYEPALDAHIGYTTFYDANRNACRSS